ncbi:hypothetical protein ACM36E_000963 [Cronobacter sakazakii]
MREAVVPLSELQTPRGANPESTVTPLMVLTIVTRSEASPVRRVPARQAFWRLRTKSLAELGGIRITGKSPCTSRIAAEIPESTIVNASAITSNISAASARTPL